MRVLVVGAGMYVTGRGTPGDGTVLPALAQASKRHAIEEVVVCATKPDPNVAVVAERVNRRLGTRLSVRFELVDRMPDCDAAIVSVPDEQHHAVGTAVLERGMHCLMVKPLAPTLAEATSLVDAACARGLYGAVELHKRWDEQNLVVKRLIGEGRLGGLAYATVEYSQRRSIPLERFAAWSDRTNIFQYLGVHYVDLLYWLTGFTPVRACGVGARGVLAARGVDTWDAVTASVTWSNGFVSQLTIGWIDPDASTALSAQKYTLVGSDARVDLEQKDRGVTLVTASGVESINPHFSQYLPTVDGGMEFAGYGPRSIYQFIDDVAAIRAGQTTPAALEAIRPSFRDALVATAVTEAVSDSLRADSAWRPIRVPAR
jgi:predicted dehydrogenase